jgi:hypothetical protein
MSYIGNTPDQQAFTPAVDFFNGNGSTTAFTLSRPVAAVAQVQAVIENVPQNPGDAFTVSGNTITFTSAPPSGTSNIYVYYTSPITQVIAPGQGTVGTQQMATGVSFTNATLAGTSNISAMFETATVTAAAPSSTTNFDVSTQAVQYYTSNAANNFTLNIRGNSSTTLNSILTTGQSITLALLVTNGATPYYMTALQVDGVSQTIRWQGGTAPTSGNASSIDIYAVTLVKTGSATYITLASQSQFK